MKKIVVILSSVFFAVGVHAQGFDHGGFPPPGPGFGLGLPGPGLWEDLDLTAAQEEQLKQVLNANRSALRAAQLAVLKAQQALEQAAYANPSDQTTITADAAALGAALGQSTALRAKVEAQVATLLTDAQKQKLAEAHQRLENRQAKLIQQLSSSS